MGSLTNKTVRPLCNRARNNRRLPASALDCGHDNSTGAFIDRKMAQSAGNRRRRSTATSGRQREPLSANSSAIQQAAKRRWRIQATTGRRLTAALVLGRHERKRVQSATGCRQPTAAGGHYRGGSSAVAAAAAVSAAPAPAPALSGSANRRPCASVSRAQAASDSRRQIANHQCCRDHNASGRNPCPHNHHHHHHHLHQQQLDFSVSGRVGQRKRKSG